LKKLLTLPTKVQRLVHGKELSVQAATALADLPPNEQAQVVATLLPGEQPSVPAAPVRSPSQDQRVEEQPAIAPPDEPSAPVPQAETKPETLSQAVNRRVRESKVARGGRQARSLKEVRTFFEELSGPAEKPGVKRLAELMVKFIQGQLLDKTMTKHINSLFPKVAPDVEPEEAAESDPEPTQEPEPMPVNQDVPAGAVAQSEHTAVA